MGSLNLIGLTSTIFNIGFLSVEITPVCGIIVLFFFLLIIISGFLIFKSIKNVPNYEEDRVIGANQGIAKKKIDN